MDIKCECGGTLMPATLENFDFSALAGIGVLLQEAPGYRCSACQRETLDGEVINEVLHWLAREVVRIPQRLPADHARFLRKHMRLSQKALAERMGIARETVAKWETSETIISPQHDMMLRSIAATYLARSSQMPLTLVEMADVLNHVREDEPLTPPPPFIIDRALHELRLAQSCG